jgi:hypothetical protein
MAVSTRENVISGTTSQMVFPALSREGIVATPADQAIRLELGGSGRWISAMASKCDELKGLPPNDGLTGV